MSVESRHIAAPELYGNYWFNSDPVSIYNHQGEIILIDFWDYSNIHCIRTLPYIQHWQYKYREFGLIVIGVHTPEFEFARSPELVQKAAEHFNITYPVMLDNTGLIWNAFGARSLPTRALIDRNGFIRFIDNGGTSFVDFERAIQQLLIEAGCHGTLPPLSAPLCDEDQAGAVCYRPTNEMYLGYLKGAIGNPGGYNPESTIEYKDPGIYLQERFYATGKWMNERECFRFNGDPGEDGAILVPYQGCDVSAVMGSKDGSVCEVVLRQDNRLLADIKGEDVIRLDGDRTSVLVDVPRMYQVIRNKKFGSHLLKLITSSTNLEIYTITFTTCVIPELISAN